MEHEWHTDILIFTDWEIFDFRGVHGHVCFCLSQHHIWDKFCTQTDLN